MKFGHKPNGNQVLLLRAQILSISLAKEENFWKQGGKFDILKVYSFICQATEHQLFFGRSAKEVHRK